MHMLLHCINFHVIKVYVYVLRVSVALPRYYYTVFFLPQVSLKVVVITKDHIVMNASDRCG